jgi:hypothetical protein
MKDAPAFGVLEKTRVSAASGKRSAGEEYEIEGEKSEPSDLW